ncbi:CsiV family protein [Alkalimarinus coralli]|uniref:CsiV family protein n=1 Tax=Alkalimarinus coralli TaxID=2935863 RepID=UPI00202AF948|nr:CsiV family protein [Alkalimarinus coralli]
MKPKNLHRAITRFTLVLTLALSTIGAATAQANSKDNEAVSWYQIEIILFKHLQKFELEKERDTLDLPPISQKYVLVKGKPMVNSQLQRLDTSKLKLAKSYKAMSRSKNYKVLEFAGWKQPLIKEQGGIPLVIEAGEKFGKHHELQGRLTFRKSRYLHLIADLYMADYMRGSDINLQTWLLEDDSIALPITQLNKIANDISLHTNGNKTDKNGDNNEDNKTFDTEPTENYIANNISHMSEARRMRSGEIHYLDHPAFGLLVTIEPTDPPFVYNERR